MNGETLPFAVNHICFKQQDKHPPDCLPSNISKPKWRTFVLLMRLQLILCSCLDFCLKKKRSETETKDSGERYVLSVRGHLNVDVYRNVVSATFLNLQDRTVWQQIKTSRFLISGILVQLFPIKGGPRLGAIIKLAR